MKNILIKLNIEKALFYLLLFLLIFIPLYPKFPFFNVGGTYVAVRLEDIVIGIVIALWTYHMFSIGDWDFFLKENIGKAFLLFFGLGIFSLFSGIFLTHTVTPHLGILHFLRRVEFMMLLPVSATIFNSRGRLKWVLTVLIVTLVLVNIYALGQQYLGWPVISTTNSEFAKGQILRLTPGARANSTFAGHYDLAIYLAAALAFFAAIFFEFKKTIKVLIILLSGVSFFVLILTAARVSFVAAFIGIISALVLTKKKKYLVLIFIVVVAAFIYPSQLRDRFVSTITVNLLNLGKRYEGRNLSQQLEGKLNIPTLPYRMASRSALQAPFASPEAGIPTDITPGEPIDEVELAVYRSFQIRLNIEWPRAVNGFLKNPLTGLGYSSLGIATDNDFLRSLGEVGLLGTVAFALCLIAIIKKIKRGLQSSKIKYLSAGTISVIVTVLVNGLFIDVFEASKIASLFWILLGLNIGVLKNINNEDSS